MWHDETFYGDLSGILEREEMRKTEPGMTARPMEGDSGLSIAKNRGAHVRGLEFEEDGFLIFSDDHAITGVVATSEEN